MADADALIGAALQQSGCLPENADAATWSAKDVDCDALVAIVCKCLARVQSAAAADSQLDIALPESSTAPVGVAARHRLGSQLANILKALGYAGDCGYNHFLYPSEKETRTMLTWLVGKLPRAASPADSTAPAGATESASLQASLSHATMPGASTSTSPAPLLSTEQIQCVFASWKRTKTLYVLPNRRVAGLRGFQSLALKTAPVPLPWHEPDDGADAGGFLFDAFPRAALQPASLLEALASSQRKRAQRMGLFEDDDVDEAVPVTASRARAHKLLSSDATLRDAAGASAVDSERVAAIKSDLSIAKSGFADQDDWDDDDDDDDAETGADRSAFGATSGPFNVIAPLGDLDALASAEPTMQDSPVSSSALVQEQSETPPSVWSSSSLGAMESLPSDEAEQALLQQLTTQVAETQARVVKMRSVLAREQAALSDLQTSIDASKQHGLALKRSLASRQQTLAMLPQAAANIAKLESICAASAEKLAELERDVAAQRAPLEAQEAALRAMKSTRKARCRALVAEMKRFRLEMKDMAGAIERKVDSLRILERTYAQLPQHVHRSMYTARILEIIKQVHKQKREIANVIRDITALQKQLNSASETLKRSEAVVDDQLYSAASAAVASSSSSKDTSSNPFVECYRRVADVRALYEELIVAVRDVGRKENSARDLENWIAQLQSRDSGRHLDKVLTDLESVQIENSAMVEQLRLQTQSVV